MTSESTLTNGESIIIQIESILTKIGPNADVIPVLCKGCRLVLPIHSFLCSVDGTKCYRLRLQCRACINKSTKHYRAHREDLKAARQLREQQSERVTCVCGVSIYAHHREKHYLTKRHQTVTALLQATSNNDALVETREEDLLAWHAKRSKQRAGEHASTTALPMDDDGPSMERYRLGSCIDVTGKRTA